MADLDLYQGAYSGPQIDSALAKVIGADATPTANSQNMVTSGGVKSAIDAVTSQTIGHASAENPTILSGNGSNVLSVQLPAGIYLVTARLAVSNAYSGWLQINLFAGDGIGVFGNGGSEVTSAGVSKTIGTCGVVKLTAASTTISVFTLGFGPGVINGTSVTLDYYKLN